MADSTDSEQARKDFAAERSHKDAQTGNENGRTAGQAVILINGGAATAILAFLAKDKLDPGVLLLAPWSLVGYALGVIAGAWMLFCSTRSVEEYSLYWSLLSTYQPGNIDSEAVRQRGWKWQQRMRHAFLMSILAFFLSSFFVAYIVARSVPPQQLPSTATSVPSVQSSPTPTGAPAANPK